MEATKTSRIALIQPRITSGKSLGIKKSPESIQSLAGQLEARGFPVKMFHEAPGEELMKALKEFAPDLVGISTMTPNFPEGIAIAEEIRATREDVRIVLGGWHASGVVRAHESGQENESLQELIGVSSPFDFIVTGEGDIVLPSIAQKMEDGEDLSDLPRIITARRIRDLNILADPSWEGLPVEEYRDLRSGELDLSVHSKRACRFKCGFCSTPTVYGKGVSTFSPERTVDQIENILKEFGPEVITFTDEDFFANSGWIEKIVAILEERNLHDKYGIKFDTFASLNDIIKLKRQGKSDLLTRMKKVGFNSFTVGIESLNPRVLRQYNKELMILPMMGQEEREIYRSAPQEKQDEMLISHYMNYAQQAIDFAQHHGILIVGDYILGNLDETEEEVRAGFEKFSQLRGLLTAYIPIFTPFPGTSLWKEAYDSDLIKRLPNGNIDWASFNVSRGALNLDYDIKALRNELEIAFYTSERYLEDMRLTLKTRPELKGLFLGRFNYLERTFGRNKIIEQRLEELSLLQ